MRRVSCLIKMIELWVLITFRIFRMANGPSKIDHRLMSWEPEFRRKNVHDPFFHF